MTLHISVANALAALSQRTSLMVSHFAGHALDLWRWHCERLRESGPYRTAIAAGVTAVMAELTLSPIAAAALTALVGAYAAAYATQTRTSSGYDSGYERDWDNPWT